MGHEKFSNSAKSGYNKGTIRSDIRYLVVSKDVRRHRLLTVTAEVASSSLVVPAIPNQALTPVEEFSRGDKKVQIPRQATNFRAQLPYNNVYVQPRPGGLISPLRALVQLLFAISNKQRDNSGVGCTLGGCHSLGVSIQGHTDRGVPQQFLHYFQIRSHGPKECGVRVPG